MEPLQLFLIALAVLNVIAFFAMGLDKWKAARGSSRTPEKTLWTLAFLGGFLGIYAGGQTFRHKTVKQSFRVRFWLASAGALAWMGALLWLVYFRQD